MNDVILSILFIMLGLFVGIITMIILNYIKNNLSGKKAESIIDKANKEADKIKRNYLLDAKEEAHKLKIETEKEIKEKKNEIKESEERLLLRENNIDKRDQTLQNREQMLEERENNLVNKQREIQKEQDKVENIKKQQVELLEKIAGYSKNEARELVLKKVEEMMNLEISAYIKDREVEAKLEVDKKAKSLLVAAMQKYAGDVASDQTVTVVNLPNDDMKGRLIGREGRNIRSIEAVTGVDLIIDDTPEAIVLSSFDPYRREIARVTIEALIKDGRIHPGRIEEIYDKTVKEMKLKLLEYGEEALFELGITKVDPELQELLGKLYFRTSFGQNALTALFRGELTDRMTSEHRDSSNTGSMQKNTRSTTAFSVFFYYRDTKTMVLDGEEFEYNWLFFEVSEDDEFSYKVFGVRNHTSTTSDFLTSSSSPVTFNYNYNAKANFSELYDYILELVNIAYDA